MFIHLNVFMLISVRSMLVRGLGIATMLVLASLPIAAVACLPACNGQTLTTPNFSHQDLTKANFEGATIVGGVFVRANLTGANFNNAIFQGVPGHPTQTPDFTFANLTNATFVGAKFAAPTYFTYATLTCADFSETDFSNGNAVFGDEPLIYTAPAGKNDCRTLFRNTTMNCEFINDWRQFDLNGAVVTACVTKLAGRNFANAIMPNVNFESAILDGATFAGANLNGANLNGASLQCTGKQCVDLSNAQLQGAKLVKANLTGASLYGAFLAQDATGKNPAQLAQAHLKNVNLANAQLSGVTFAYANFYGDQPANGGGCKTTGGGNLTGFTIGCASANSAQMTDTQFEGAYLYGVDFRNTRMLAVNFQNAVLIGANFGSASIRQNPNTNLPANFQGAHMQGTNLKDATFSNVDFSNAFFDFRNQGNIAYINLNGTLHNTFACSSPSTCVPSTGADVCVYLQYSTTTVSPGDATVTCPDGTTGSCGTPADPHWNSPWAIGKPPPGPPPGWYVDDATYTPKAADKDICNGNGSKVRVILW